MKTAKGICFFSATYDELATDVLTSCYGFKASYLLKFPTKRSIVTCKDTLNYDATWPSMKNQEELNMAIEDKLQSEGLKRPIFILMETYNPEVSSLCETFCTTRDIPFKEVLTDESAIIARTELAG